MAKRVYQLAKELGLEGKEVLAKAQELGLGLTSNFNAVSPEAEGMLRKALGKSLRQPPSKTPAIKTIEEEKEEAAAPVQKIRPPKRPQGRLETAAPPRPGRKRIRPIRLRQRRPRKIPSKRPTPTLPPKERKISLHSPVTVKDLSKGLGIKANLIIAKLMQKGAMVTINELVQDDVVEEIAQEFGLEIEIKKETDLEEELLAAARTQKGELEPRAPVVTLLGHVDHGKTTILDQIRQSNITATESGGITQHIGAYRVKTKEGKYVVFLDTPGHEAFTAMRARGANVTDVVVLVVAADDGVMPQTEEAIDHAHAASVPIVVAINKIDKPEASSQRVKQQLADLDLVSEEWGGKTVCVEVSGLTGQGLDELVEMLSLEADLLELKGSPPLPAKGAVLEAAIEPGYGAVATLLIRDGTLRKGDIILCGHSFGRVRMMRDDQGQELRSAGPSGVVRISGLSDLPEAGDKFLVVDDLSKARVIAQERAHRKRMERAVVRPRITLESFFSQMREGKRQELLSIVKADVQGSAEVLQDALSGLGADEARVKILRAGVGEINVSDVLLADASDAVILGFHIGPEVKARALAEEKGVEIRQYDVIYKVIDDVREALAGLLEPVKKEVALGRAEVRQAFKVSRIGTVAGCLVLEGRAERSASLRVTRNGEKIFEGRVESLRRFKDDVREVRENLECGIKIADFDEVKVGDILEFYTIEERARTYDEMVAKAKAKKDQSNNKD